MKNNKIYKTIGEVAKEINTNTHTLRFWEKEFKQIKPKILSGKRRYYSEKEIDLLKIIYELLKNQGYTISGAKKLLNKTPLKLDDELSSGIKKKNFRSSIKLKDQKIKLLLKNPDFKLLLDFILFFVFPIS